MPMSPRKGESKTDFLARCVPEMIGTGKDKRPNDQAVAICLDIWRNKDKAQKQNVPDVEDGESHSEFMDRCTSELDDQDVDESEAEDLCQQAWEERAFKQLAGEVHFRTRADAQGLDFLLSDATADRFGDIIEVNGWDLQNFNKNPIALFSHDPRFIVGKWSNLRIEKQSLRGTLELAPEGTSDRIDEIRRLVKAGILKAVSVGFKPRKREKLNEEADEFFGPFKYINQELVETSLVAVPANPNALAVAKSLNISRATMDLVFAQVGREGGETTTREFRAKPGTSQRGQRRASAMSLAFRIVEVQSLLAAKTVELEEHWKNVDDSNVKDAELEKANELTEEIRGLEKKLTSMLASEKILAGSVTNGGESRQQQRGGTAIAVYHGSGGGNGKDGGGGDTVVSPAIIRERSKSVDPRDYLWRTAVIALGAKCWNKSTEEARAMIGKEFPIYDDDGMKGMSEYVLRSSTAPAMTTVTGWAAELVQQVYADPMPLLMPASILNRLRPKGLGMSFGRAGKINIPTRSRTPTISGSFVGEGQPIPVRMGAFTSQSLTPKKLAVISTFTREMSIHSTPAIEGIIREAIQDDTTVAVDSVLLDANAATTVRPAGLLNGVSATTATAGGGFTAFVGDVQKLSAALITNTLGNIRTPVWLMNPLEINAGKFIVAPASGEFPWKAELMAGNLNGWPIIDSGTVPAKTIVLVDAADFISVSGEGPLFSLSDQATIHEEDTTPLPLAATGTPAVVAAPQRSLWQTDSIGIRMIQDLNWLMRRSGMVVWTQAVTWS